MKVLLKRLSKVVYKCDLNVISFTKVIRLHNYVSLQ